MDTPGRSDENQLARRWALVRTLATMCARMLRCLYAVEFAVEQARRAADAIFTPTNAGRSVAAALLGLISRQSTGDRRGP